ncbi:hypothetical protein L7F22_045333 [Adiantum nelumboides]|nr:hypothetical protein [Adiantum nelumboides]
MDDYFLAVGTSPKNQVMLGMFSLTGDAKLWWKQRCNDNPTSSTSWKGMKQAKKERYLPPSHQALKMSEFYALRQIGLTLEEYYSKCPQRQNPRIIARASPQPHLAYQGKNQKGGRNGGHNRGRGGGRGARAFVAVGEPTLNDNEEERATLFAAIDNPGARQQHAIIKTTANHQGEKFELLKDCGGFCQTSAEELLQVGHASDADAVLENLLLWSLHPISSTQRQGWADSKVASNCLFHLLALILSMPKKGRPPISPSSRGGSKKQGKRGGRLVANECNDQVNVFDDLDSQEREEESQDIERESMNEIDNASVVDEVSMQIVPCMVLPEVQTPNEIGEESRLYMDRGEDILQQTRIFSCFECPPIPLCRLIPYARVRGLRDDISSLKVAFSKEGYMQEKGAFIVSIWTCGEEQTLVTDDIRRD